MAITTIAGAIAGQVPLDPWYKAEPGALTTVGPGRYASLFYAAGQPNAAAAPSPGVNGAALTTYAGQLPFGNPASGNSYLSSFSAIGTGNNAQNTLLLCDRLWHNSGLSVTSATLQSITPVAIPARDHTGTTNGRGIMAGLEVSTVMGAGVPTYTLTYTNSGGTGSRTSVIPAVVAAAPVGTFYSWNLDVGDLGVRSVEGFTASATSTSGAFHIVLYRVLASLGIMLGDTEKGIDMITSGFPRLYDNTVPFIIRMPSATQNLAIRGEWGYTQG